MASKRNPDNTELDFESDDSDFDVTDGLNDEYDFEAMGSDIVTKPNRNSSHRRNVKRRLDRLKEDRWFKRNNWFDDESFYG